MVASLLLIMPTVSAPHRVFAQADLPPFEDLARGADHTLNISSPISNVIYLTQRHKYLASLPVSGRLVRLKAKAPPFRPPVAPIACGGIVGRAAARPQLEGADISSKRADSRFDPDVWSGRAMQEVSSTLADAVLRAASAGPRARRPVRDQSACRTNTGGRRQRATIPDSHIPLRLSQPTRRTIGYIAANSARALP